MKHVPFSSATSLTFAKARIKAGPLTIISNKIPELKSLGLKEGVGSNQLTVNQTRDLISLIRAHVSFSVSIHIRVSLLCHAYHYFQTEAGCRILVNIILLHVVSNISNVEVDVGIVPEFRMDSTRFEYAPTSYGGIIDSLIVKGPPASISMKFSSDFHLPPLLIPTSSVQNFYWTDLSSRLRTQIWSNTSRQTFTKPREMGLGMQYLRLLWQLRHIADNTSKRV
jgi:hypothetical protein